MSQSKVLSYGLPGIKVLAAAGWGVTAIAREVGVSRTTLCDECHRHWGVVPRRRYRLIPVNASGVVSSQDLIRNGVTVADARAVLEAGSPIDLWRRLGTSCQVGQMWLARAGVRIEGLTTLVPGSKNNHPGERRKRYIHNKEAKEASDAS